jgi:hypothetical protein
MAGETRMGEIDEKTTTMTGIESDTEIGTDVVAKKAREGKMTVDILSVECIVRFFRVGIVIKLVKGMHCVQLVRHVLQSFLYPLYHSGSFETECKKKITIKKTAAKYGDSTRSSSKRVSQVY